MAVKSVKWLFILSAILFSLDTAFASTSCPSGPTGESPLADPALSACGAITGPDEVSKPGSYQFALTNAAGDVRWCVTGAGVSINSNGLVTIDNTACGSFTVSATDSCGETSKDVRVTDAGAWVFSYGIGTTQVGDCVACGGYGGCKPYGINCPCTSECIQGRYKVNISHIVYKSGCVKTPCPPIPCGCCNGTATCGGCTPGDRPPTPPGVCGATGSVYEWKCSGGNEVKTVCAEEACEVDVSVSPTEVAPKISTGTIGNREADVVLTLKKNDPSKGCKVLFSVEPVEFSGGHQHDGKRPTGSLSPEVVFKKDEPAGSIKHIKYVSGEVSGVEKIKAWLEGSDKKEEFTIDVKVPILGKMPESSYYTLVGQTGEHLDNHYVEAGVMSDVAKIAYEYFLLTGATLEINDTSLKWGGVFDICGKWDPAAICSRAPDGGHFTHRIGTDVDVRSRTMTQSQKDKFKHIVCDNYGYPDSHGTLEHWHIYFQAYRPAHFELCKEKQ